MNHLWHRKQLFFFPLLAMACGSSESTESTDASAADVAQLQGDTAASDAGVGSNDDGGAGDDSLGASDADTLAPPAPAAGLAVVHQDKSYKSALLSLLDPSTGTLVRDNCLNSGSLAPGLSLAMSGDVVLPSAPLPGHPLLVIDRGNGNLIWVNPANCSVTRQLSVAPGFLAYPYDVVAVTANRLYVTRYGSNPKPSTALDGGGDLVVLDLDQGVPVARVDLAPYASCIGCNPNPDRGRVLGGKLYVTLNSFNADFSQAGTGRVVVVDPTSDKVTGTIDLTGLQNCGPIVPVPGMPKALAVSCAGAFADGADQIKASGIALIDTTTTPPTVTNVAAMGFGRPVSAFDLAVVNAGLGLVVVPGDFDGKFTDEVWRFDFAGGAPQLVLGGKASFTLGGLVYDPTSQRVFVGDADAKNPRVRMMDVSGLSPVELTPVISDPDKGLLPRYLGLY